MVGAATICFSGENGYLKQIFKNHSNNTEQYVEAGKINWPISLHITEKPG